MIKKRIFIWMLVCLSNLLFAQSFNVNLSPKHSQKLTTIKSGHKRLVKFYKYYKKDSTKQVKRQEKYFKKLLDSTYRSDRRQEKIQKRLVRKGIVMPNKKLSQMDMLDTQLRQWYAVMKDSSASDSLRAKARQKVKDLAIQKAGLYPGFQHLMEQYQLGDSLNWQTVARQVPGLDTLSGIFESSPGQLFNLAEKQSINQLQKYSGAGALSSEFAQGDELKKLPENYRDQYQQYTNKEQLKSQGREKAVGEAIDYFTQHAGKLNMAQSKVSKLLAKYKDIANSDDLSSAVKKTSMKDNTFWERLVIGGNFNVLGTSPLSVDLSPQLGYKFTTRFAVGLGMNYRQTFGDSIKSRHYVSPQNTGFKLFSSYEVIKGFFTYAEAERSGNVQRLNDHASHAWKNNYFVGIGKKVSIHPKVYLNTTLLYNLRSEDKNPVHPKRFQIRFGFQLSELATRKERIAYNPNR